MAKNIHYYLGADLIATSSLPERGAISIPPAAALGYQTILDPAENPMERGDSITQEIEFATYNNSDKISEKLIGYVKPGSISFEVGRNVTEIKEWSDASIRDLLVNALKRAELPYLLLVDESEAVTTIGVGTTALATRGGTMSLERAIDEVAGEMGLTISRSRS